MTWVAGEEGLDVVIKENFCLLACLPRDHLIVSHMSPDMLGRAGAIAYEQAEDGKIIEL